MKRGRWLLGASLLLLIGYGVYDWTRPCGGGPLRSAITTLQNGGSYPVRCAG